MPVPPDLPAGALPDDARLTHQSASLPAGDAGQVLVIACGALAREIIAVRTLNGWHHLDLVCLPAILHNRPERIPDAVARAVAEHRGRYDTICVAYGDCGTGGALAQVCKRLGVSMIDAPHCYAFFEGTDTFAAHADEIDAFYLTDFLVRQFEAFVWRPLGLDRHPDLRDVYFGNYRKLVYLAQTECPDLDALAQGHAASLKLHYERRYTGYGDVPSWLRSVGAS